MISHAMEIYPCFSENKGIIARLFFGRLMVQDDHILRTRLLVRTSDYILSQLDYYVESSSSSAAAS